MKTLILVPTMYGERDLEDVLGEVPLDFQAESEEFWNYVEERLRPVARSIRGVYLILGEETIDPRGAQIVDLLRTNGAEVHRLENRALAGEARAWYLMAKGGETGIEREMLEETSRELSQTLQDMVDSSLGDGEMGVAFYEPVSRLQLRGDLRWIRMLPFDPEDYLSRHLALKRLSRAS